MELKVKNYIFEKHLKLHEYYFILCLYLGRSQMFARIVNPDSVRPVFIQQQSSNQDTGQGSSESNS